MRPKFLQARLNEVAVPAGTDVSTSGTITALSVVDTSNVRLTAADAVAGIVAPVAPVTSGKVLLLTNANTNLMFINDEDASATAANRITTGTSAPVQVSPGAVVMLAYDSAASRWRILGGTGSGSGGGYFKNYLDLYFTSDVTPTVNNGGVSATGNRTAPSNVWASPNTASFSFQRTASSPLRGLYSYVTTGASSGAAAFIESPVFVLDPADRENIGGFPSRYLTAMLDAQLTGASSSWQIAVVRYNSSLVFQDETSFGTFSQSSLAAFPVALSAALATYNTGDLVALRVRRTAGAGQLKWDRTALTPDQIATNGRQAFMGQKVFLKGVQTQNTPAFYATESTDVIPSGETRFAGRLVVPSGTTIQVDGDLVAAGAITGTGTLTGSGTITSI